MEEFFSASEMMAVRPQMSMIPLCGACGLDKTCRSPHMPPDGGFRKRIMVVAEAPGEDEDREGRPLVGRTGQELERVLARVGVDMWQDCLLHNVVICRPPDNDLPKKAPDYCRANLIKTLQKYDPEVIIVLGGVAVRSLVGHYWKASNDDIGGIGKWVGWHIPCGPRLRDDVGFRPNAWICPTYHPSFLLRAKDQVLDAEFEAHLRAAVALSDRPWPDGPPDYEAEVEVILSADEAAQRVRKYRAGAIAFDFENTPLKPFGTESDLVSCSICWEDQETIAFPWHGVVKQAVCELLEDGAVGKVASNLKHEDNWCSAHLGIKVRGWDIAAGGWDTMLGAHALDPRGGVTSIKFQSWVRLGCPNYNRTVEPFLKPKKEKGGYAQNRIRSVKIQDLLRYNGLDSLLEFRVADIQRKEMGL